MRSTADPSAARRPSSADSGMRVNLDATRLLLEQCRRLPKPPRFVFTSSLAVFGGALPDPVTDDTVLTPQTSYGTQKAIGYCSSTT